MLHSELESESCFVPPSLELIHQLIRDAIITRFKTNLRYEVSIQICVLAMDDRLRSSLHLGMDSGKFSIPLYLQRLAEAPGLEYIISKLLPRLNGILVKEEIPFIDRIVHQSCFRAMYDVPDYLEKVSCQEKFGIPFSIQLLKDEKVFDKICSGLNWFISDQFIVPEHLLLKALSGIEEITSLPRTPGAAPSELLSALNGSKMVIYRIVERLMVENRLLKPYLNVLNRYFDKLDDPVLLLHLIHQERMAMGDQTMIFEQRSFASQALRNAVALNLDPSLFAYLPCKVIEFEDYIPDCKIFS